MCKCRAYLREFYEQRNAPAKNSRGSREMEGDGGLRRQASRCLQEVFRRMGQGVPKTAGNLASVPSARLASLLLRRHHRLWSEQISGALHDSELSAYRTKRRHWHTKLRSYPKIS